MACLPLISLLRMGVEKDAPPSSASRQIAFTLPDLMADGKTLTYPREDKPYIVNVFASWCASCALEHPFLMELQGKYGVRMHGILWRDSREKGRQWIEKKGNPYQSVGLDESGDAAGFLLDVTGAPETLVLDAGGAVLYRQRGPLTPDIMRDMIAPLLMP